MAETTGISWADATFNPWIGCTKVSPGCDHCYAERDMAIRRGRVTWGAGAPRSRTSVAYWKQPLAWNRKASAKGEATHVFCASLADVFDNEVPQQWRLDLFDLIEETPHLIWMLLTKRVGNVMAMLKTHDWCLGRPNVWLGITVVNQEEVYRDVPKLLAVPARLRWLSIEPQVGPITFRWAPGRPLSREHSTDHLDGLRALDWIITGGESGPGARNYDVAWARTLIGECREAKVPCFVKQLGAWPIDDSRPSDFVYTEGGRNRPIHLTKHRAGADPAEWPEDLRVQEFPR